MYTLDFAIPVGPAKAGMAELLRGQLVDSNGVDVGDPISSGFVDTGSGYYLLHCTTVPDSHRGGIKFYFTDNPTEIVALSSINPEEGENTDDKISTVLARLQEIEDLVNINIVAPGQDLVDQLIAAVGQATFNVRPERTVLGPCKTRDVFEIRKIKRA